MAASNSFFVCTLVLMLRSHVVLYYHADVKQGNIEDWLCDLLFRMQWTVKDLTRVCAGEVANLTNDISGLRGFVDG